MNIKLVASDMDGTLLGREGMISDRTADTIRELQELGCGFVVCTGRAWEDASFPLRQKGICCDVICMNGAAVYDSLGNQMLSQELSQEQLQGILDSCEEGFVYDFMTDQGSWTINSREEFRQCFLDGILLPMAGGVSLEYIESRFSFTERDQLFSRGLRFYKMSVISHDPAALERTRRRLSAREDLAVAASHSTNLEITSSQAQKGLALLSYARERGILPGEILAVGDSENDRSMLSLPLGFTLAMENGMESIKKTARCQTRSNEEDGVAYAIENLIFREEKRFPSKNALQPAG